MKSFLKSNWPLLLAILVVAIVAGVVANLLTKQVPVDPTTGEEVAGNVTAGRLSLKNAKAIIK